MTYSEHPLQPFVDQFNAKKQQVWGMTAASIDDFIRDEILDHVRLSVGLSPTVVRTVTSDEYIESLGNRINTQVNLGLAIIAHRPEVTIYGNSPYQIVDRQIFGQALNQLFASFLDVPKWERRQRTNRSIVWADACAYRILKATANGLVRR